MSSFIEPTSDPAPIGVWEGEYKFAADQIIVVGRAVAFAVPAVMLVSLLIFFLDGIAAKGSFVDPGIFSVILGLLISEVMTMLSIATELVRLLYEKLHGLVFTIDIQKDPKWAIVKSLPSATVTVGGSIATAVAVERIYQDRVQVRAGFITGYLIFHWIAGFVWRFCFFGKVLDKLLQRCTPRRVEDESGVADEEKTTVPTEAPKSSLKLFFRRLCDFTVVLVVVGYMGISICVQVSRLYTGNLLVTFTLFAIFSLLQNLFFLTSAQANELNGEEKHKLVKSTEQFFMPAFAMFLIPIKLFRLMQAIRNPAYTFWPLLFLSQIFDRALPRLLFGRQAMAKAKKLKEAAEAAISLDGDYNEPDLLLSDLPPPTNSMEFLSDRWVPSYPKRIPVEHRVSMKGQLPNEIAYIHEEDVSIQGDQIQRVASIPRGSDGEHRVSIQYQSSQRTTSFLEEEDYIDGLPTRSNTLLRSNTTNSDSPKNFDSGVPSAMNRHLSVLGPHRQRSTLRRQRTFTTSHGSLQTNVIHTATVRVVKKIMEVGDIQFPVSHDIIRRDHCTAEYASMLISLALVCVSPGDFLALPGHDMGVVRQEFYGVNGVGDDSGREYLLGTNDLVLMLGGRPLAAVVLTTVVSLLYAGVIERVVVMWEKSQGFPMYTVRSKFQPRVYFTIVTAITIMLVYIFAGARGLFAFGPLQVKYDIN
ncbi:hypothetical protein BC829DRAFT_408253 [Chytridium lagenaria]|nr:hypothetical protein BC829DRAFT_408253 [Chytridium lagenaria]